MHIDLLLRKFVLYIRVYAYIFLVKFILATYAIFGKDSYVVENGSFVIWGDNDVESDWFQGLTKQLENSEIQNIGPRGSNLELIDELVKYDRPDIILLKQGKPVLVLEKTREVPTGHNIGQRIARLVRAAEHGVPVVYFLPFDARKHGTHSGVCSINTRLFRAMIRMSEIHNVPVIPVNWPVDSDGELIINGSENKEVEEIVENLIKTFPEIDVNFFQEKVFQLEKELHKRNLKHPPYEKLPNSVGFRNTLDFFSEVGKKPNSLLKLRDESLIYTIDMSPSKCRREDPYTGMQFIYDYGWLRNGPKPKDRVHNLILYIPQVTVDRWKSANPNDPGRKSCNWYLTADAIVLKDGIIVIDHS